MKKLIIVLIALFAGCTQSNKDYINKINELELKIEFMEKKDSILNIYIIENQTQINKILKHEIDQNDNVEMIYNILETIKRTDDAKQKNFLYYQINLNQSLKDIRYRINELEKQ